MKLAWTTAESAAFRDAYLDWSALLAARRDAVPPPAPDHGAAWEPVFVRLAAGDPVTRRQALRTAVLDPDEPLLMDPHERAMLEDRIADPVALQGLADEYALYRRLGTADDDHAALFTVLDTGVPVRIADDPVPAATPIGVAPSAHPGNPIVAVIDDGCGFLNARFRRPGATHTRFHAVWIQALENRGAGKSVIAGRVLDAAAIDAMIATGSEGDAYARLNADLFRGEGRHATAFSTSHGTQVLDLAGGADPAGNDPARFWPLLAVQLPPEAVEDTAGTRSESYMVQGMRWILRSARAIDPAAPVIVNISMGILAGPKNGTRFAEYQIAREAALWEQATGQPVRVVWAFGNTYRGDLVAQHVYKAAKVRKNPERSLCWRVQPGDQTASYVEIHAQGATSDRIEVSLDGPDGSRSGFAALAPGQMRSARDRAGRTVARLYHVPARDFGAGRVCAAHYVIALSPTEARKAGEPLAPAGAWTIGLRHAGAEALSVSLQVQRDDALRGFRAVARQSYFDDPAAHVWDNERQDWGALAPDGPITHAGTHNALSSAPERQVLRAGAARRKPVTAAQEAVNYRPAPYTAQGADWSVASPTVATVTEEGSFLRGVPAVATLSGGMARLGGTSAAAGRLSRALALSPLTTNQDGGGLGGTAFVLIPTDPADAARLGSHVVEFLKTPVPVG